MRYIHQKARSAFMLICIAICSATVVYWHWFILPEVNAIFDDVSCKGMPSARMSLGVSPKIDEFEDGADETLDIPVILPADQSTDQR